MAVNGFPRSSVSQLLRSIQNQQLPGMFIILAPLRPAPRASPFDSQYAGAPSPQVLVAILANALIVSVFPVAALMHIPPNFIAVCLIPVVGNVAELATAVMAATRDELDLTIAVALGSATQIALFLARLSQRPCVLKRERKSLK